MDHSGPSVDYSSLYVTYGVYTSNSGAVVGSTWGSPTAAYRKVNPTSQTSRHMYPIYGIYILYIPYIKRRFQGNAKEVPLNKQPVTRDARGRFQTHENKDNSPLGRRHQWDRRQLSKRDKRETLDSETRFTGKVDEESREAHNKQSKDTNKDRHYSVTISRKHYITTDRRPIEPPK